MGDRAQEKAGDGHDRDRRNRLLDILIILLCLSGAAFFVNLFRVDLFGTLDAKNEKPVGTIIVKNNVVQRRMANRVIWDRLVVNSPAYMGDLIRTADISDATLQIDNSSLELGEKTLMRIQRSRDGDGLIQIDLVDGNLGLGTGAGDNGLILNLMGRKVRTGPDTAINATAGKDGIVVKVSKGTATFIDGDQMREITSGGMVSLDADGREQTDKAAAAFQPRPNARYLKNGTEPLHINFAWNSANLDTGERLRLEIAGDKDFNRIVKVMENLESGAAEVDLNAGTWYWRLSTIGWSNRIISTERFTVTEASGLVLFSPVTDSLFRYQDDLPQIRFQWSKVEGTVSYILEASDNPDFKNTWLRLQTSSVFLLDSSFGQGTWYWRVMPVFPSVYEGSAAFSPASFFRIEQGAFETALVLPEPVIEPPPVQPEPVIEPPPVQPAPRPPAPRQQTTPRQPAPRQPAPRQPASVAARPSQPAPVQPARVTEQPSQPVPVIEQAPTLLPAPVNLQPPGGHRIGIEELKTQTNIVFSWSEVQGANAYIFTLYEERSNGRRQIISRPPEDSTSWTLENFRTLGQGTFVWQVEAVNRNSTGVVEQRGRIGEGTFILGVPAPGTLRFEDPGILYGY